MAQEDVQKIVQKEFPPFKPAAYFGGNLLLGELSYLLLRQYLRFFIFFTVAIILAFVPTLSKFAFIIVLASAIDAMLIAKKMKNKEIPIPEKNKTLNVVIVTLWIIELILVIYSIYVLSHAQFFFGF